MWLMEDILCFVIVEEGWVCYSLWGMGIVFCDLMGDGFFEVYLILMGD